MNTKSIIILAIAIPVLMTLILLALFGVYKYDRTLLGFPPVPSDTVAVDTVVPPKMVEITEKRLRNLEYGMRSKAELRAVIDTLKNDKKILSDSISRFEKAKDSIEKSFQPLKDEKDSIKNEIKQLNDSLANLVSDYDKAKKDLERYKKLAESRLNSIRKKADSSEAENQAKFAKIYENANPGEVARILEQIDERDAAKILKMMNKKKAGKIIEAMSPESAAAILLLGGSE